jgi:PAS domain S-box-containing protein
MSNSRKTKAEILNELAELRQEVARLKAIEAECFELKQQMSARDLNVLTDVTERRQSEAMLAKRADALETVVRVSTAVLTALEVDKLLQEVADLTRERFGLYHAHIYLLDEEGETLQLVAGAGDVGRQMVAEGWSIPLKQEQSPVSRAAWDAEGVIVNNVREDPGWLPNPLLPDTRSEMAVPLMIGGLVLGVLDVQSDQVNFFSEEDVHIHTMLAAQIGVALENADQHERTRAVLGEAEESQALLRSIIDATPDWIFIKDQEHRYRLANQGYANALHLNPEDFIGKNDLELGFPEELVKGNPEQGIRGFWADDRLVMDSGEPQVYLDDPATIDGVVHTFHTIKTPLRDANGEIGSVLAFARDITEVKQAEEAVRKGEERYRRLFEDPPISLWEEDFSVIKTYTDQLRSEGITDFRTFFDQHPEVVLEYANLAVVVDVNPATLKIYQAASKTEFFNGLRQIFGSESLETFKEEMIAVAEGKTRFESESVHYTLAGSKIYVTLSWSVLPGYEQSYSSIAVSLVNITERKQAEEVLAKRAAELEAVAQVSTATATVLKVGQLLQEVVDLAKEHFGLYHAHIYLFNEAGDTLNLAAGAGEVGRQMVAEEWSIPLSREVSLVAQAARTRQGVIVNDVRQEPDFLPNPLLPKTRAEMAVPMIVGERVLGVLDVQSAEVDHFSDEDVHIQTTLAAQVAVALENARSFAEQQRTGLLLGKRVKELNLLNEIGREIAESPPIPQFLEWVTGRIPPAMQYPDLCQASIEYEGQAYGEAAAIARPCQTVHALLVQNEVVGRVYIAYTEKRDFLDEESALLGGIANRISGYIESRRLYEQTRLTLAEVRQSQELLHSVINSTPDWIFIKDQEHRYRLANQGYANALHMKPEDFIGKNDLELGFPEELVKGNPEQGIRGFWADDRLVMDSGETQIYPDDPATIDGVVHTFHTIKTPLRDANGEIWGVLAFARDITERKQVEEELRRSEANLKQTEKELQAANVRIQEILESINVPMSISNVSDGKIVYANEPMAEMFRVSREELQSWVITDIYHTPSDREGYAQALRQQEYVSNFELYLKRADGDAFWGLASGRIINFQGEPAVITSAVDITERKLAEAERERLLAEVQAAYRQYVRQEWERTLTERGGEWRIEHQQADLSTEHNRNGVGRATVEAPVILRGQQIGSLKLEDVDPDRRWSPEELALLNTVSEQLALTVENLRLFEDTQKRATREQLARQITEKMRNAPDVDSIVETGLTELAKALGVARTYVKFTSSFEQQEEQQSPGAEIEAIRTKLKHNGREGVASSASRQRKGTDISDQVEEI